MKIKQENVRRQAVDRLFNQVSGYSSAFKDAVVKVPSPDPPRRILCKNPGCLGAQDGEETVER